MVEQKVASVTGASRGIGKTVARGLIEDSFRLALIARSPENLQIENYHAVKRDIC